MPKGATDDPEAWGKDYQTICGSFSDDVLDRAANLIMVSREKTTFPLPSECNRACLDALEMLAGERRRASDPNAGSRVSDRAKQDAWARRSDVADKLFAECQFAAEALQSEWWWRLWSWIQETQRLPDVHEIKQIQAKGMADYQQFLEDIDGNPFAGQLKSWRNNAKSRMQALLTGEASRGLVGEVTT